MTFKFTLTSFFNVFLTLFCGTLYKKAFYIISIQDNLIIIIKCIIISCVPCNISIFLYKSQIDNKLRFNKFEHVKKNEFYIYQQFSIRFN